MKKHILFFAFAFVALSAMAQSFEGVIDFKKYTASDTVNYRYYVKDVNVRIEELSKKGDVVGVMLVLPKINSVRALNMERKLYMDMPNNSTPIVKGTPEITKTTTSKEIAGQKCTLWRVKNTDENTECSFWVAPGKYDFFLPLLKTLNRKDKLSTYFIPIPENANVFPVEADEKTLLRQNINTLRATKIEKKVVDSKLFMIPTDFKKYEK